VFSFAVDGFGKRVNGMKIRSLVLISALMACSEYQTSQTEQHDEGTELSVVGLTVGDPVCNGDDTGTISLTGVLETTGSVDSALVTLSVNGAAPTTIDVIPPGGFIDRDGRIKDAPFVESVTLDNGTHTLQLCFVQSGSQGREEKKVCTDVLTVVVDCGDADECARQGAFGNLVGNPSLCTGNTPRIPIHWRGSFGEDASVAISGPGGFSATIDMRHAGNSCIYQGQWNTDADADGNGGAGSYTFVISGGGNTDFFTASVGDCTQP
jgi:hypothetical protein